MYAPPLFRWLSQTSLYIKLVRYILIAFRYIIYKVYTQIFAFENNSNIEEKFIRFKSRRA